MVLRPRNRLRRVVVATALGALLVPAAADAKAKTPVIRKVTPTTASVGTKLTLTGRNFKRGKAKNSVLFRRDKGKALFVKADVSTAKRLTVVVPKTLEKYMNTLAGRPVPTRFRLRVLAGRLSRAYTARKRSPVIGPARAAGGGSGGAGVPPAPDGDCDGDGARNRGDADDDNDLLGDGLELMLVLDPCVVDTDGDGVEDGFEYRSAIDLNDDDYQHPNVSLPYPGKTPYPNARFGDADVDYDGDGLTLGVEYRLWKYAAARTLDPLSYSDGKQYSISVATDDYLPPQAFRRWAEVSGYARLATGDLYDIDHDGTVWPDPHGFQDQAESQYWDIRRDHRVSDDERDEDVDGLTNYDEANGPLSSQDWWTKCYRAEGTYPIPYAGTSPFDADSDGDGILDGADDQDFDDIPNIQERSRNMAGNVPQQNANCVKPSIEAAGPSGTWVNPFNPCLPNRSSRTCPVHPLIGAPYPPFQDQWKRYVLN
jgi:hypothetical protein